ncbi:hypothetical protein MLD38_038024 [Melastoma candidum]|uniref:Uncharacterized protein n=1 Tax=Melastoma candidum TaxID=119954 RepID=A0ACB9KY82_9MYRT|nr:hypothetical protein MLD38_038024 [Melastoma candidum]
MWRRAATLLRPGRAMTSRGSASSAVAFASKAKVQTVSAAVNSMLLRSLKEHYLEVSKMTPPPKVNPPEAFTIVKGALDNDGPVLNRTFNNEEISIHVTRLVNIIPADVGEKDTEDDINQLFLHVCVSKPEQEEGLHFLCGLYPDALGIHSVSMRPKLESSGYAVVPSKYNGPPFENLDEKVRDAFHAFIDERGINESLFPFLQAWLYVKDHRNLMHWFKSVGVFISDKSTKDA